MALTWTVKYKLGQLKDNNIPGIYIYIYSMCTHMYQRVTGLWDPENSLIYGCHKNLASLFDVHITGNHLKIDNNSICSFL